MSTSTLYDFPLISVQHNESSTIISRATMQLIQSEGQDIHALETRAKALADCAQSDMALRDASEIIRLAPSSSIGHSLTGWIHTLFGQHEIALQCYNRALRVEDNPVRCQEFDECRKYNAQRLLKRIDFVSNLPLELLSFILPRTLQISSIGDLGYLHVCKTWRQRVLQSSQLRWTRPTVLSSCDMHLLHAYVPYIQYLWLLCPVLYPLGARPGTRFTSLRTLYINLDSNRCISALLSLFGSIGQSLKELHLLFNRRIRGQWIRFDDILHHFPNIEVFSSRNVHLSPLRQTYVNIRGLMIQSIYNPLEEHEIITLLKQLPALRHLQLPRCQSSHPLSTIHQYCPSLRTLVYSMIEDADIVYIADRVIKATGFHTLVVKAERGFKIHDLASALTAYSDTVVYMSLVGNITYEGYTMDLDPNVRFPCLRDIRFRLNAGQQGKELLQWILKDAPNVTLIARIPYNIDDPQVYESMKEMQGLGYLDFSLPSPSLVRVLEYHAALGEQSTLHTLKISSNGDHCARVLHPISRFSTLLIIHLHLGNAIIGQEFVAIVENLFGGCLWLQELELHCDNELPHDIIHKFPMCTCLETLVLQTPNNWGECLLDLLECPSLLSIDIPADNLPIAVEEALSHLLD